MSPGESVNVVSASLARDASRALLLTETGHAVIIDLEGRKDCLRYAAPGSQLENAALGADGKSLFFSRDARTAVLGDMGEKLAEFDCGGVIVAGEPVTPTRASVLIDNAPFELDAIAKELLSPWLKDMDSVPPLLGVARPQTGSGPAVFEAGFRWVRVDSLGSDPRFFDGHPEKIPDNEIGTFGRSPCGGSRLQAWDDIRVFNTLSGELQVHLPMGVIAYSGAVTAGGGRIVLGSPSGALIVIDTERDEEFVIEVAEHGLVSLALSADGALALWRSGAGKAGIADLITRTPRPVNLHARVEAALAA